MGFSSQFDMNTGEGFSLGANKFDFNNIIKANNGTNNIGADTSFTNNDNFKFNAGSAWDSSGVSGTSTFAPTFWDKAIGYTNPNTGMTAGGFAGPAVGLLQAGLGYSLGRDTLDLSKEQLATSKQQFSDQFNTQTKLTNMDIMDHARARYNRDPVNNPNPNSTEWQTANLL